MINKISKLLALAEGASTAAEAEASFAKAQALASAHAISLAEARANTRDKERRDSPIHKTITIGELRKRANKHLILLMSAITRVNDVEINIASNSTYVILFGYPQDITTSETLWIHISHKMVRSGEKYLAEGSWRTEPRAGFSYPGRPPLASVSKQTARSSYYAGFIASLSAKLIDARETEVARAQERSRNHPGAGSATTIPQPNSTALALQDKTEEVGRYYRTHSTARGSWTTGRRTTAHSVAAKAAGQRDGKRIRLRDSTGISTGPKQVSG